MSEAWTSSTSRATSSATSARHERGDRAVLHVAVRRDVPAIRENRGQRRGSDPLFTYLQQQKGFEGFDDDHELTPILEDLLSKDDPDYAGKPDIKWNFTKFLVDREGNVVRRFEPTASIPDVVAPAVEELL